MVGHKLQYFNLQVSFVGWWVLTFVTFDLVGVYFYPYYALALAGFYKKLDDKK